MKIETILFDLDGTLLDTNRLIRESFVYTLNRYEIPFTEKDLTEYNGPPLIETFTRLYPEKAEEMVTTYRKHNIENHDKYVTLFPNALETLERLSEKGLKTAIVTNKMRDVTLMGLRLTQLDKYFTAERIITLSDVSEAKPHPEGILKAMNVLESQAVSTVIVGDSYHDLEAGQRAGIMTAGVSWSEKGEDLLKSYNPTYMIDDLKDLLTFI